MPSVASMSGPPAPNARRNRHRLVVVGDLVGEGSAQEQSAVGETPYLADRLKVLAEPDTIVIAAGTHRLVGNLFEYRDLGAVAVQGLARSAPVWQVLGSSGVASRFEALRGSALSPLVGRGEEIDLLLRRWARVKAGMAKSYCSWVNRASASRESPRPSRSASTLSRIFACAISAHPITRTVRFIHSSTNSAGRQGSDVTNRPHHG